MSCRAGRSLAAALTNLALGQTLAVVELDEAVAEVDEALAIIGGNHQLARAPVVLGSAAFVLADTQPDRAGSLMRASLAAESSRFGQGLLHSHARRCRRAPRRAQTRARVLARRSKWPPRGRV